jgi:antitoxin (DNA-binding transcriptional repressor) of toxin-antitoxin stability system
MTKVVNIHEAKTHLSRLIEDVLAGETVVIAKAGVPLVDLSVHVQAPRKFGVYKDVWPDIPNSTLMDSDPDALAAHLSNLDEVL